MNEIYICECGSKIISKNINIKNHLKTISHIKFINNKINIENISYQDLIKKLKQNNNNKKFNIIENINFEGSLTYRIKKIISIEKYDKIIKCLFNNLDIRKKNKIIIENIIDSQSLEIIKNLHEINPSLTGIFFDYLLRRLINEIRNEPFYDDRSYKNYIKKS